MGQRWAAHPTPGDEPGRYLLRPAELGDLDELVRLAGDSAIGISSLPPDREALRAKIAASLQALANEDEAGPADTYLFVLQDLACPGPLIGTSGISARAGEQDRFYSYRNEFIVQASPALGVRQRVHTLHLCHDLTGWSLLTGFHIEAAYAHTLAPQLLSRARLMFMALWPARFAEHIASEHPGLADAAGRCPFWDGVGHHFFGLAYAEAERLAQGRGRAFLADLMPQTPLYVPLLPEEAQWAIGQLHPVAELPFAILLDEGLEADTYLNVFDGGPTSGGHLSQLKTPSRLRALSAAPAPTSPGPEAGQGGAWHLVCNGERAGFRATLLPVDLLGHGLPLDDRLARALCLAPGDPLQAAALDLPQQHPLAGSEPWP